MPALPRDLNFFSDFAYHGAMLKPAPLDRRRLLLAATAIAVPAIAAPVFAAAATKNAEIAFQVDDPRLRALFASRLRKHLARILGGDLDISADAAGARIKPRRAEDAPRLAAALAGFAEVETVSAAADGARIVWSAAALDTQARIWRDRAKAMLQQALGARKSTCADRDARNFVLTVEAMDRAQWTSWIGGRIDLFFPAPFAIAPVVAPGPAGFSPRLLARGGLTATVAVDAAKTLGGEDDIFVARVEGDRLILELNRLGAALFAEQHLPGADKTAFALMFDKALAAVAVLDGPFGAGRLRLRIERGLGAADLAPLILIGGSAPMVKQVEARFT